MADLEAAISMDKSYEAFIAQWVNPAENQEGKVAKTLAYHEVAPEVQQRMDEARVKEWEKYKSFNAVVVAHKEEKQKLLEEGHEVVPSKWVETIKNIHEQDQPGHVPVHKARLVSCGNLERVEKGELRCDSPTSDPECHLLLASFASTMKWRVCAADIANAYFQGAPMTRLLFMSRPRGGLSKYDPEVPADSLLPCRVPIYF